MQMKISKARIMTILIKKEMMILILISQIIKETPNQQNKVKASNHHLKIMDKKNNQKVFLKLTRQLIYKTKSGTLKSLPKRLIKIIMMQMPKNLML